MISQTTSGVKKKRKKENLFKLSDSIQYTKFCMLFHAESLNIFNFLDVNHSSLAVSILSISPQCCCNEAGNANRTHRAVPSLQKNIQIHEKASVFELLVFVLMVFLFPVERVTAGRSQPVL